jgi:rhodanese-related sulfurtransferase
MSGGTKMPILAGNPVTEIPAANSADALAHFERLLELETDCWDVHVAIKSGSTGFILLDVRAPESFAQGHIQGAVSLPHGRINERNVGQFPAGALFVVYCNGPHCNGADRAAARLARLGRPVKKMIGGVTGWLEEGFPLVTV